MTEKQSILCFGDSLTSGFFSYGLEYHSYAIKLSEILEKEFGIRKFTLDVDGRPGDLVVLPQGSFLSRIQAKCSKKKYDWVIILGGTKYDLPLDDVGFANTS